MLPFAKLEGYVKDGESMRIGVIEEADSPEEASQKYTRMVSQKDEHGEKQYVSTRVHIAVYKQLEDPAEFFKQFKA